ncbi:MAG TPA: hypothetical protein VF489_08625 [Sphingobium sp.]
MTGESLKSAMDLYEHDEHYHALVESVVAAVIEEHGPEARDIAVVAAAAMLARIYQDDAELHVLQGKLEHYRVRSEMSSLSPVATKMMEGY